MRKIIIYALLSVVGLVGIYFVTKRIQTIIKNENHVCNSVDIQNFREKEMLVEFHGKLVKKFKDPDRKSAPIFILDDGLRYHTLNVNLYDHAEVGDSIVKNKGSLKRILIKRDTVLTFFPYCCGELIVE